MTVILVRITTKPLSLRISINQKGIVKLVERNSDVEGQKCRNKFKTSNNSSKYAVVRTPDVLPQYLLHPDNVAARIQKSYSKLSASKQTKFKVRCSRFVYTLAIDDLDKADKIRQSLPPCIHSFWGDADFLALKIEETGVAKKKSKK